MKKEIPQRVIKGEVEGFSRQITPFPGNRGSRGIKVEGEWHNIIGARDFLDLAEETFRAGTFVELTEKENKKGFWDVVEGSLKKITKEECYARETQHELATQKPVPVEKVSEPQMKKLDPKMEEYYKLEIEKWSVNILEKEEELVKLAYNQRHLEESILKRIATEENNIIGANAVIIDLRFDFENRVSMSGLIVKQKEVLKEIERIRLNIKVRKNQIENGVEIKDG